MHLVNIPLSALSGCLCDRFGNKWFLFWGAIDVSFAMPFWLLETPKQWWWLCGAYVLWGGFAMVNIAGQNLMLKLAPRSDNTAHMDLFRQVGGLLAGASGLLDGLWISRLRDSDFGFEVGVYHFGSFQLLFVVSWFGRVIAVFWVLPITEPGAKRFGRVAETLSRWRRSRKVQPSPG